MRTITNQDRRAIERIHKKVLREVGPAARDMARQRDIKASYDMGDMMAAQNTLRICLEVVLKNCMPYDVTFLGELGVRMAAYIVSAAPIEDHERLADALAGSLAGAVERKVAEGAIIKTNWQRDGDDTETPNVPDLSRYKRGHL